MECNIGLQGPMPCPVCLVPLKSLADTSQTWPDRDPNWKEKVQRSGGDLDKEAKQLGMRSTPVSDRSFSSITQLIICPERF